MRVRFTPEARSDLRQILNYIDERNPSGARNVKAAIRRTVRLISDFPRAGRLEPTLGVRVFTAEPYPYLVYWTIERDAVAIVHIRHARRKPWRDEIAERNN
jgi:plasmid stabilization system protein ParE